MSTHRAAEHAEHAELDALLKRFFALQSPSEGVRCFCGSLEDLRRTVADLEAQHERQFGA